MYLKCIIMFTVKLSRISDAQQQNSTKTALAIHGNVKTVQVIPDKL